MEKITTENDMDVSRKFFCLFILLSVPRVNLISHLKITNMYLTNTEFTLVFDDVLKQSRPSFKEKRLVFRAFSQNPKLCVVSTLVQYLNIRLSWSPDTALFLTTVRLYKGASSDTIARWMKNTVQEPGINIDLFFTP